ncbi:MAG: Fe-S-binding domain-containing protein, partial [Candidatus Binatota bacterium]|nr:Fe-S-binding domain-containing protein [Candidatus Binatota bacterium]
MMSAQGFADLTLLLAIPVIGAAVLVFLPRRQSAGLFSIALLASTAAFLWSLKILARFDGTNGEMQLVERVAWMPAFGIQYILGIDGISIFLVLLTTFLMPLALLASWSVRDKVKEYLIFMLL